MVHFMDGMFSCFHCIFARVLDDGQGEHQRVLKQSLELEKHNIENTTRYGDIVARKE